MIAKRLSTIAPLLACALAMAGCGLTSSPADGLTFKPPAGWQASPGIMGFMQFWKSPSDDNEILMLFKSPKKLDESQVFTTANLRDEKMKSRQDINICGRQHAVYLQGTATGKGGNKDVRMVMSDANGTTYFSMYVYPAGAPANGEATSALRELCTKP
jgi:hypothetical protein